MNQIGTIPVIALPGRVPVGANTVERCRSGVLANELAVYPGLPGSPTEIGRSFWEPMSADYRQAHLNSTRSTGLATSGMSMTAPHRTVFRGSFVDVIHGD